MGGYAFLSYIFWAGVSTSPNFNIDEWRIEDYLLLGLFHQFFRGKCFCRIARFQGRCAVTRRMMLLTMAKCGKLGAELLTGMSLAYEIRCMRLKKSGGQVGMVYNTAVDEDLMRYIT